VRDLHVVSFIQVSSPTYYMHFTSLRTCCVVVYIREGADKSLAQPGRKQATATKLGIYSTYPPRSSIHVLSSCSYFCKPLKKIQHVVRPTRSRRQHDFCVGRKMATSPFPADFCIRNFFGARQGEPLCRHSIYCCFVSGS
jgi:hypothetical protein